MSKNKANPFKQIYIYTHADTHCNTDNIITKNPSQGHTYILTRGSIIIIIIIIMITIIFIII